jgi:hypothetical protein
MAAIESTLLMGAVLLVIIVAIGLIRDWERSPAPEKDQAASLVGALRSPMVWTVGFVVLALLFMFGAVAFVGGSTVLGIGSGTAELLLVGGFGAAMAGFLFAGLYAAARNRGLKGAQAAGIGSIILGLLAVVVISLRLLTV